jgi:hypothetical protein
LKPAKNNCFQRRSYTEDVSSGGRKMYEGPSMRNRQDGKAWLIVLVLLVLAGGGAYYLYEQKQAELAAVVEPPPIADTIELSRPEEPSPEVSTEDELTTVVDEVEYQPDVTEPLPDLIASDEEAMQVAEEIIGEGPARNYLVTEGLISKLVSTIDALSGEEVPGNIIPVQGPGGETQATSDGFTDAVNPETGLPEPLYIFDPVNFQRYTAQVEVLESIDTDQLVANYRHYYPLLQQSWRELGHADSEFEDRLIEVIDELLAAPEPEQPVQLIRPEAYYEFADPELEALPAGQKILIRMGPSNASRVKTKLEEIRSAIQTQRE